ncbi:flippase [Flavobacteriaceae bacterium TP-CH-4]|uniref:Flippase n=1 Tax=Pelagihabitans pacificus TaxID=2696054 RepID=A0A967E7A3_9FLAO|nr:flippase [Pelagihabitans pacificus]NHF61382.1 flippase [Pelagihabitans pacificus]
MNSFNKDVASVGFSKVIIVVFGLLNSVLVARLLGPATNGIIDSFTVYTSLFMTIGSLGIRQATTFFVGKEKYLLEDIKKAIVFIWLFTSVISFLACFFLIYKFSSNGQNTTWSLLAVAPLPFSLYNTYNSGIYLGQNKISNFNRINWIPVFVTFVSNTILLLVFNLKVTGVLIAVLIGNISITLVLIRKDNIIRYFNSWPEIKIIKSMLSLGLVYAIALLTISLNYKIDVILLDKLSSAYEIGIYGKGVKIVEYLWQIPMLLSTIVFARSAIAKNGKDFSFKVLKLLRFSFVIVGILSVVLFFMASFIVILMFGDDFTGSTTVLRLLLPGVVLMIIFKVLNMDLAGKGKPWIAAKAMIPALLINIVLNIVLIPKDGANGAALSSTISYSIASLLFLFFYLKEVEISFKEVWHLKKTDFDIVFTILKKLTN